MLSRLVYRSKTFSVIKVCLMDFSSINIINFYVGSYKLCNFQMQAFYVIWKICNYNGTARTMFEIIVCLWP